MDELPDAEVTAAKHFLEYLQGTHDPILQSLMKAPEDDEPLTRDDIAVIEEGKAARNGAVSLTDDELCQKFGL